MANESDLPDPLAPWPTLAERDSGKAAEAELFEGVPPHLEQNLHDWVMQATRGEDDLVQTVLSRFRISWHRGSLGITTAEAGRRQALSEMMLNDFTLISSPRPVDPLSVLDAIIALHPAWWSSQQRRHIRKHSENQDYDYIERTSRQFVALEALLRDAGSAWRFDPDAQRLLRRVDPTATEAWRRARTVAESSGRTAAAANLATAWHEIYGRHPNPTAGYAAAVKAVEAVAVPVLAPDTGKTVHSAARGLRKHPEAWQFTLIEDKEAPPGTGSADIVSAMLDRLLKGETGRHTSDDSNRDSTQAEAEAAVHLAVTLVQWFASEAIRAQDASSIADAS